MPEIQVKDKLVTVEELGTAYNDLKTTATQSADGLMSSTDKTKLDGIASGAQVNAVTSVNNQTGAVSITPANIGAVAKSGDTMTGDLVIRKSDPYLIMQDDNGVSQVQWIGDTNQHKGIVVERHTGDNNFDFFYFPDPSAAGNSTGYDLLSTKNAVTVPQGGTGATTPAQACANIGAVAKGKFTSTKLYEGTPAVGATFSLSDYISNYNILVIMDKTHYSAAVFMPVFNNTQTIMANGSTSFPDGTTPRFIIWEFTAITSDGKNFTVARKAQLNIESTGVEYGTLTGSFSIEIYGLK